MDKKVSIHSSFSKEKKSDQCIEDMKTAMHDNHECCVLITCSKPKENGEMQVEMMYDGDESLAAYLVETAKGVFEQKQSDRSIDSC